MNVEKGNIIIASDGRYIISLGIVLKKVTFNDSKVVNKEFSQIILLAPNKNTKQWTSQNNLLTKLAENVSNDTNVFSSSKNPFRAQRYLQESLSKPSETIDYLNKYN
uniref:CN hydrolase domain-containing protein n=1 Tax=Strongyloides venezuelensis TaxID=75913 RepID=A0A0K0FHM1_STRVS